MDGRMLRQGDVLMIPATIPTNARPRAMEARGHVLAHGEATGHAHVLDGDVEVLVAEDGRVYARVASGTVVHEEHSPVAVPPGSYEVVRQREWQDEESRNVAD